MNFTQWCSTKVDDAKMVQQLAQARLDKAKQEYEEAQVVLELATARLASTQLYVSSGLAKKEFYSGAATRHATELNSFEYVYLW